MAQENGLRMGSAFRHVLPQRQPRHHNGGTSSISLLKRQLHGRRVRCCLAQRTKVSMGRASIHLLEKSRSHGLYPPLPSCE
jgi:hypothetical protein